MKIEIDRDDLECLIKGHDLDYSKFSNELVKKAGHEYIDCYGRTYWTELKNLTTEELCELYLICKNK